MTIIPKNIKNKLGKRPYLIKIIDNISWLLLDKALRAGVGLFVGAWVARYLGPEDYGLISYANAINGIFGAFVALGFQGVVVRDLVRNPKVTNITLGTSFVLQLISGLIAYLLILAIINYLKPNNATAYYIVALFGSTMLFKASDNVVYYFESQVMSKYVVWVQNGVFLIFALIKLTLIINQAEFTYFVWSLYLEVIFIALILLFVLDTYGISIVNLRFSIKRAKQLLADSWPLLITGIVMMIQANIDQIMLSQINSDVELGYYSAALKIIGIGSMASILLLSTFQPYIISTKRKSISLYYSKLREFINLNIVISIIILFGLYAFADSIINILYGGGYSQSVSMLRILSFRIILTHIAVVRTIYLLSEGKMKYSAATMILGTIVNISLNFYFLPESGGVGASIVSVISYIVSTIFIDILYYGKRYMPFIVYRIKFNNIK